LAQQIHPAVAVIDIGLPDLDGFQIAQRLRREPFGKQMVLLALTGYGRADDRRRVQELGFDAHLVKPVNLDELARLLVHAAPNRPQ
jgi:two-component system CheB/CheR fusion protein